MSQFIYLLNALESAAQGPYPAELGYGKKRDAVLAYVADLERTVALLRKPSSAPTEALPNDLAVQELKNIFFAERFNRDHFTDDTEFANWARSRAGFTLGKLGVPVDAVPSIPSPQRDSRQQGTTAEECIRALVNQWREFGPEHFDETIEAAAKRFGPQRDESPK